MRNKMKVCVIGGGQAGFQVCESLVRKDFQGKLFLVDKENFSPYQRPPLSKSYLSGELEKDRIFFRPKEYYQDNGIELICGQRVEDVNLDAKEAYLSNRTIINFDKLVIATGAGLRKIENRNQDVEINYLGSLKEGTYLAEKLLKAKRITIIGGGFIGLEIASVCIKRGLEVCVVEKEDRLMKRAVPGDISKFYKKYHEDKGVKIVTDSSIKKIDKLQNSYDLTLNNGQRLRSDLLLAGIGVSPNISLAEKLGLVCDNGIKVDESGFASNENIFAVGDCANFYNVLLQSFIRPESVQHSVDTAKVVAENILGNFTAYDSVPWFWSDQYDLKLQIAATSTRFDMTKTVQYTPKSLSTFCFKNGIHIATFSINRPADIFITKKILANGSRLTIKHLENPDFDFKLFAAK